MFIKANKIFYHHERIKAYLNDELVRPISVKLRLTDNCNLNCYYCSYKGDLDNGEMAWSDALMVLKALKEMGVKGIVFTGGEPTIYPRFSEMAQYAKRQYDFDLALITNGVACPIVPEYFTWTRFSLDTVDSEIFKRTKGADKLNDVLKNIEAYIKARDSKNLKSTIGIQAIINRYNFDYQFKEIRNVIKYAVFVGADYVQIRPLENYKYSKDELMLIKDNIKDLKNRDFGIKILTTDYKWYEIENGYRKNYKGCPSADFMGSVDVHGDFYICCAMINDETAKYGNLLTDRPMDILKNRKKVQEQFDYSKCTVACQGSLLNQTLHDFKNIQHTNFV